RRNEHGWAAHCRIRLRADRRLPGARLRLDRRDLRSDELPGRTHNCAERQRRGRGWTVVNCEFVKVGTSYRCTFCGRQFKRPVLIGCHKAPRPANQLPPVKGVATSAVHPTKGLGDWVESALSKIGVTPE